MAAIHAPMATGIPAGVTASDISPPVRSSNRQKCACKCGRTVDTEYEHYRSGDQLFYEWRCVLDYFEVEEVI